jgi:putative phosphoesterase
MRIAIFSDLHANADALAALDGSYDELWFLGDMVGYGPDVSEAIAFVSRHCSLVVRGNHDNAAVTPDPIGCSPVNEPLALATRDYTRSMLDRGEAAYLRSLPLSARVERGGVRFYLTHGSPRDPLYEYVRPSITDEVLSRMVQGLDTDVVLLGHTHLAMQRRIGETLIVNPGSLGQPRDGDWRASYAVWEDGALRICRRQYDRARQLQRINAMPLRPTLRTQLRNLLLEARVAETGSRKGDRPH